MAGSSLIRKWWYQVFVNDTAGNAVSNANVTPYNITGIQQYSILTNETGWTNITTLTEYVNTAGTRTYYSNYTIYVYNYTSPPYLIGGQNFSRNITLSHNIVPDVITLNYDNTPPNVSLLSPENNSFQASTPNFTANLTDNSGLLNATLFIYNDTGSKINQTSRTFTGTVLNFVIGIPVYLIDGVYHWFYNVFDTSNIQFTSQNNTFTVDTVVPILTIVYPINMNYNINVSTMNYSLITANPNLCWYSLDLGVTNSTPVAAGVNFSDLTSTEGSNTWIVYCNSSSGIEDSDSVTFWKDTVIPLISISYPENTTYNYNVSEMNYTFIELNPSKCWYSIDNGITNGTPVTCGTNYSSLSSVEGSNTWTV
jgi:hypothetical protein